MAHRGRQGPRTLHREYSLLSPLRFHVYDYLRFEVKIVLDGAEATLQTDWSTQAFFKTDPMGYAWDCRWEQMGVKWILFVDMDCRPDVGEGLVWKWRLDQFSAYGSADWRFRNKNVETWFDNTPVGWAEPWLDVTLFGPHIQRIREVKAWGRRWSDFP